MLLQDGIHNIIIQLLWLIVMVILGMILMKKNLKRVVVQGG